MKKILLTILAATFVIGGLYHGLRTSNAHNVNGTASTGTKKLNPIIGKIEKEEKKIASIIASKNLERFKHELGNYRGILLRSNEITEERPFPFTEDSNRIIQTLDYILFNGIFCKNNTAHFINENEELDMVTAKADATIHGIENTVCSNNLESMQAYLKGYSTMLDHAKKTIPELEKPTSPKEQPANIIDVLDYII